MPGLTASNLPAVCGVGAVTCTWSARKRAIQHPYRHPATAGWGTERNLIPPTVEAAGTPRKKCDRESRRERPRIQREGCSLPATPPQDHPSRCATQQQQQPQPPSVAQACPLSLEAQPTTITRPVQTPVCEHVHTSLTDISADHDRAQLGRVRSRQSSGYDKNCMKTLGK
jgi:hypothetical protein